MIDADELAPADELDEADDLTAIANAHPVVRKRLDIEKLNAKELLSLGDLEDMSRELGTSPDRLVSVLTRGGQRVALDVAIVLAWIIGRKGDPSLELDYVRRFWQIELVGVGTTKPDPTPASAMPKRSRALAGSSRKRG